ncbi:uncharacterized protein LOC142786442 isoform X4 [Rhipicephalus microplus]|uniref:uncharacterized protein LOC142786442 isoform X4 n=1 Tax=Rhipicephalus microplus TaxID=6941 RepID=UPI003F6D1CFA
MQLPKDCLALPLSSLEELMDFDKYMSDQANMESVTSYFSLKEGSDSKDAVRRVLRHIISKAVVVQCSWAGSSGNKFPFKSLSNVLLLILGATHTLFSTTDAVVADTTKWWLMFAADQEGGRTQRRHASMNKKSQNS